MLKSEDFRQIDKNGYDFEALVSQIFTAMGYRVLEKPAIGTDHGRDIIVERHINDPFGSKTERVIVQCKHKAHSGKPVYESELIAWENTFTKHNAQCYLLVTSSNVSEGLNKAFNSFNKNNNQNRQASFWDVYDLIKHLNEYPSVRNIFFKEKYPSEFKLNKHGWCAIFSEQTRPGVKKALRPLLDLRKRQAGHLYKECTYRDGEDYFDFLNRHDIAPGTSLTPNKLPLFLCIIGEPSEIPFSFITSLECKHAVGRISFPSPRQYAKYAKSIVDFETSVQVHEKSMTILAAGHHDDPTMNLCIENLIKPIPDMIKKSLKNWKFKMITGLHGTKKVFHKILNTNEGGDLIFLAAHGLHDKHKKMDGSLVTSEWQPGKAIDKSMIFSANDLQESATLSGKIIFALGCYSAGHNNDHKAIGNPKIGLSSIVDISSYVSHLSQEILSHKNGSALAFIGHSGPVFEQSFTWRGTPQPHMISDILNSLILGHPAGIAMRSVYSKCSELEMCLQEMKERNASAYDILYLSQALRDARSYTLLGDPYARLI